jgi:hypothetical protein
MNNYVQEIFTKSCNQKGLIYVCKKQNGQFKYGKTKNIENRLKMYGQEYNLLTIQNVNHLSLREELIRNDWNIQKDRRYKDARDEHTDFDCQELVEWYAKCIIKLDFKTQKLNCYLGDESISKPFNFILNILHF